MADNKQHDTRTTRRPDCVTEIRMGNSVLVVSGYFKKDTTTTAADKMARVRGSGSRCYTGADLSGVNRGSGKSGHAGEAWPLELEKLKSGTLFFFTSLIPKSANTRDQNNQTNTYLVRYRGTIEINTTNN